MIATESADHHLSRGLGFWPATAINITQIVGAGVFATIPLILGKLPGVYGLLAWLLAGVLILCDAMIWAELAAAMPASGGSYQYLRESFGRTRWGRLMSFLFVWQILISGPLEVGSGLVAAAQFSTAISPDFEEFDKTRTWAADIPIGEGKTIGLAFGPSRAVGVALGLLIIVLLYRRVTALGKLSLLFLVGVLGIIGWVLIEGGVRFDPALALALPATSEFELPFREALGSAMGLAIYSYLGYYNICYLGGEVRDPARTMPRAIIASALCVIILFTLVQLAITGVMPNAETQTKAAKDNLTAVFMTRIHGQWAASVVSVFLVASCFASAFSGVLGYSRVPFAAAREGHFFRWFAAVHPEHRIPHRSLFLVGGMMLVWSFFSLQAVIDALIVTRILEQFVAQAFAVMLLRRSGHPLPWRMWLYPIPCIIAIVGWLFVYAMTGWLFMAMGAGTLAVGAVVFFIRAKQIGEWPFQPLRDSDAL